ncbi:MAG: non-canonical purine NTP pyrophosphatase [Bacteriovoracaceae bacterium]|nr:non-canonical purine NTP pyrophosphatase [Bacteriovoracaceae bacterium]
MAQSFLLATGNAHKADEFSELFPGDIISVSCAPEKVEVVEDGLTFSENALKKAEAYYRKFGQPVMADDSGLNVSALPEELGIHTARFGGDGLSSGQRNELLIDRLKDKEGSDRTAAFVCVLCFYLSPEEIFFFEGRLAGSINNEQSGEGGFGYDPVFIPEEADGVKSLAELPDWKQKCSHRAKACQSALKFFKERVGQN